MLIDIDQCGFARAIREERSLGADARLALCIPLHAPDPPKHESPEVEPRESFRVKQPRTRRGPKRRRAVTKLLNTADLAAALLWSSEEHVADGEVSLAMRGKRDSAAGSCVAAELLPDSAPTRAEHVHRVDWSRLGRCQDQV